MKNRNLLRALAFLILAVFPQVALSQVKGKIIITNGEAGGNAAAYGLTYLHGPLNRTQTFACPRSSSGLLPTGRVQCDTTYGSFSQAEWQPGDSLTASAAPETSAEVPYELRTDNNFRCYVKFTGWSGPCQGLGTKNTAQNVYECTFTLPMSGDVEIGAFYSGTDAFGNPCLALSNPAPAPAPTATPGPQATTNSNSGDSSGDRLLTSLSKSADELADNLRLRDIIRGTAKFLIPQTPEFSYDVTVSVKAVGEGSSPLTQSAANSSRKKVKLETISKKPIIASGNAKSSLSKVQKIKLASTAKGIKVATGRKSLTVQIAVTMKGGTVVVPKVVTTRVIYK